ncbi:MAG: heat shock protein HspQ [Candidatus Eisenbacteria bacterium]|uniref:Heat shock protein HspQ n=1 Tax=Eiseniibacteriota bacterium TaxID=2212470 RepID=A0A956NJD8_UNCEI|nr:heat shock protein HspQ [Candidatus Eisenbacteria bacterium]MCB9462402.1 heat shock protein HspQ [Candidatus Eisenbacteria bacterium]
MGEKKDLVHLLKLIDDPEPSVRRAVDEKLGTYGWELGGTLASLDPRPDPEHLRLIEGRLSADRRVRLRGRWRAWMAEPTGWRKLESALAAIAEYQTGITRPTPLSEHLDRLTAEYQTAYPESSPETLAEFLFRDRLSGAPSGGWRSHHSNLVYVIEEGEGLPLALACVYLLVGARLGLELEGCNFPKHFYARFRRDGVVVLVDGYRKGELIQESEMVRRHPELGDAARVFCRMPTDAEAIVLRALRNVIQSYAREKRKDDRQVFRSWHDELMQSLREAGDVAPIELSPAPAFQTGQLVKHKKNGYRGVIVNLDLTCQADEDWYLSNPTQPDKQQPWYHVLVDGAQVVTYTAENSLEPDDSKAEVRHPLVPYFFEAFEKGRYRRNREPWPGWHTQR